MRLTPFLRLAVSRPAPVRRAARRASARRRARFAVLSFPFSVVCLVAALWAAADQLHPAATDPDFCTRRDLLRERMAEQPDAAVTLILGSSRAFYGFAPEG